MNDPHYLRLNNGDKLPELRMPKPFKALVILQEEVSPEWQVAASLWLVQQGCRYMMSWGIGCSSWDDSVDYANLEIYPTEPLPDADFVMTTSHADETLQELFIFAKNSARHPSLELNDVIIIHIARDEKKRHFIEEYSHAS